MVDLYNAPSISGYNSNPPSDDGAQTAANEVTWSKHKTKLGDPLKSYADSINTAANTLAESLFGNAITEISTATNLATTDYGKKFVTTNAITLTLLDGADAGSNFVFIVQNNDGSGNALTLGRNGNNINGAASDFTVGDGQSALCFCDGTNWFVDLLGFNINGLTTDTTFDLDNDYIPYYDATDSGANKTTVRNLLQNALQLGTEQATTSGTTKDFTIPSGTRRITINFNGVSSNSTSNYLIQLGDSGGVETSGYVSSSGSIGNALASSTAGLVVTQTVGAASTYYGSVTIELIDSANFQWIMSAVTTAQGGNAFISAGEKSLSAELTTVRVTTESGDTFDAGSVNITYE